jgi:hypothetical protein
LGISLTLCFFARQSRRLLSPYVAAIDFVNARQRKHRRRTTHLSKKSAALFALRSISALIP